MGPMKVLHVIGGGEFGGAEQHLLTLIKHMDKSDFELHIACLFAEPLASLARSEGLRVHVLPMKSKLDLQPIGSIASLIKREGFHIVHTHGVRANLIGRLAAKIAGTGLVVTTVHSVLAFDYQKWSDRWINRVSENTTRGVTERFITVCDMLAGQLVSEGVPRDKVITIHNGLEIEKYNPGISGSPIREELGITGDAVLIGIVARLHPVKGHIYLLEAMARSVKKFPGLMLLIVGTGPDRATLEETAGSLGVDKNVIFTGFRKDIPEVLAALDFLVLPSLSEGLSLTVIEGMAMKKPVLATGVGGTPEIITPGLDGCLVPPADVAALAAGIEGLAQDRQKVAEMGAAARKTVETRFTAELMANKTARLYKDLGIKGGSL
ncbi:MAG: glycosyltransferase [Eubacteriales bacterium]